MSALATSARLARGRERVLAALVSAAVGVGSLSALDPTTLRPGAWTLLFYTLLAASVCAALVLVVVGRHLSDRALGVLISCLMVLVVVSVLANQSRAGGAFNVVLLLPCAVFAAVYLPRAVCRAVTVVLVVCVGVIMRAVTGELVQWLTLVALPLLSFVGTTEVVLRLRNRLEAAAEALQDAFTDPMTGLLNRRGLADRLDRWLGHGPITLVAVDLDGFRRINEEAGHEVGDRVLRRVADQLTALAGPGTLVARIDGDDFALAFSGADTSRASVLAREARFHLGRPFDLGRHRLHLTVNVGTVHSHAVTARTEKPAATDDILRCADQTLTEAQASASGTAVHDPARCGHAQNTGLLTWVDDLHAAFAADDQLLLHFQPQHRIVETGTGTVATVVGCEALLRWAHPTRGLLGPAELLRAAEHAHLGAAVTERVLELALAAATTWWADREVPVAVNLSATDLDDELLPHRIADALERHGLPARALTVEVVEDTLMLDPDRALQTLTALRSIGLRIAVDDYGTGYSSLAYLHRLPIDEVKFDRSLTAGISSDPAAAVIVGHSIRLAHDLGLSTLAEGIEEPADLDLLFRLGCHAVQGYLTGRPQPLTDWVATALHGPDHVQSSSSLPLSR